MELCLWQRIDPVNGLVEPWLTYGALDWIKSQDWSDKVVLMFGAGMGDAWLAKRCKWLHVVERNNDWLFKASTNCADNSSFNVTYHNRPCDDCCGKDEMYCAIPEGVVPDVVINDDAYRYEVIVKALTLKNPLTLITDNWMQAFVFICPAAVELLKDYPQEIYEQADHQDHDGVNKWKTAIFHINKKS